MPDPDEVHHMDHEHDMEQHDHEEDGLETKEHDHVIEL